MRQFSLLLLICNFPLASLIKCINNIRIAPKPMKNPLMIARCTSNHVCFKSRTKFDGSYEHLNEDALGCMTKTKVIELLTDPDMGDILSAPDDIESALESSSFEINFEFLDYHFCTREFWTIMIIDLSTALSSLLLKKIAEYELSLHTSINSYTQNLSSLPLLHNAWPLIYPITLLFRSLSFQNIVHFAVNYLVTLKMLMLSLVFLLFSLLPVQSLNCLHGPFNNSTKVSCPVSKRWCYSIQNVQSDQVIFANRGCDEKNMCERLKWVGREVVQLLPQLTLFTSYSFCFDAMNQSICCCDRDNCNTGLWMEPMKRPLASSPSESHRIVTSLILIMFLLF